MGQLLLFEPESFKDQQWLFLIKIHPPSPIIDNLTNPKYVGIDPQPQTTSIQICSQLTTQKDIATKIELRQSFVSIIQHMDPNPGLKPIHIDEKAYFFFPSDKEQKTSFDKNGTRFYYYGQIEHDEFEKGKLAEFDKYLFENKLDVNRDFWNQQKILQFLSGNGYREKETYEAMLEHEKFRVEYLGTNNEKVQIEPIRDLIEKGMFYPCGRDKNFRPILVFNAKKIDLKDFERSLKATLFVHEAVIQNMFLPGQVESWNIIYDLSNMGITEIPGNILKSIIGKLSQNYGGRLFKLWIVNAPMTVSIGWKIVSTFMDKITVEKIKISKKNTEKDIFVMCDPSQVEKKYGGTQPDRTSYWPFVIPEGVFDESRLMPHAQYAKLLEDGKLSRNVVHPKFLPQ